MREMSKSAETDLILVNAIREKGGRTAEVAFEKIYKKYHDPLLFQFGGLIKDKEDAKELILDAFAKVNVNLEKYNEEESVFSTWLFKLTKNIFIDYLRKKKEDTTSLTDMATCDSENHFIEYEIESPDKNPEAQILSKERNKKMVDIIEKMENKELAEVVKLRFFEGLSYEQISVVTGKPLGTVKAFLHRAKQVLETEFLKANLITEKNKKS